uniref:Uncharacterized protein n=1 Tax=Oryza meridionalis TaxID=40149 RepID=A0A0E0DXT3_9ORYZ
MAESSSLDLSKTMAASGFLIFLLRGPAAPSAVTLRGRSGRGGGGGGGLAFSASSSNSGTSISFGHTKLRPIETRPK